MTSAKLDIKLKQTQKLSQHLRQSLNVLQMSNQELEEAVEKWLTDNPFLEKTEPQADDLPQVQYTQPSEYKMLSGDDAESVWENMAANAGLSAMLHEQVCEHRLDDTTAAHIHVLIDSLDEHGYLADSLADIADNTPLEWHLSEAQLSHALHALQQFDPPGVGARDLTESLLLQLARQENTPTHALAEILVRHHLGKWQNGVQQKQLQRALPQYTNEQIQAAIRLIASLNPYPSSGLGDDEPTHYIRPDVVVRPDKHGIWQAEVLFAERPHIRLHSEYSEWLADASVDKALRTKFQEAQAHIDSIAMRENTLMRLSKWIVTKQQDFFSFGAMGLSPLLLKDAARDLELAESTISRAVNQKYLACSQGIFALRYFFSNAVSADENDEGSSQTAVKALLENLIRNENPKKPFSDTALMQQLEKQGINIARRTVAKYREAMGIPPVHVRKKSN
ncbi:RNA polymerase factor sigma-54 [Stenoxybacter acetivorans]|uniref:RNA polymerase factor sigma-54 n=1 Tax=Stenoxybacter acetivorans TaxID=422441 RepID=UPI00055A163D|nr:RNA polymerase factor sigma-54 [Stenoxybacter acetivorans]